MAGAARLLFRFRRGVVAIAQRRVRILGKQGRVADLAVAFGALYMGEMIIRDIAILASYLQNNRGCLSR